MDAPDVTRTTASRKSSGWMRGALVIPASGIAAVVVAGMSFEGPAGRPWMAVAAPAALLMAGGVLAGIQADPPFTRRRFRAYLLMPLPTILLVLLAIAAFWGAWESGLRDTYGALVVLAGLWELPLLVTLLVRSRADQRERAELQRLRVPFGPPPLEGELAAATQNSRSPTVIREYIDDALGQKQLDADEVALLPHGYELVSVEELRRPELLRALGQLFTLLILRTIPDAESSNDRIVATFQRRPK